MKYLRYYAEFLDVDSVAYRIEILQEAESAYTPQEVQLAADPVTIEWGEVSKIDPVMGSGATLRLISMSDRQFIDLYTVEMCAIRMDVYRAGVLYWSGTLDTELFEEPYSLKDRYITEVTFSDFGVLDRLTWEQRGLLTISEVINTCLVASNINYTLFEKNISTTIPDVEGSILDNCVVSADNFFDEDGEAWPMREVLEEVLRPFTLQLKQKNGAIHISDLNSLAEKGTRNVEWRNADARLGVEPTYNKAVLTFSPYSQTELFDGSFEEDDIIPDPNSSGTTIFFVPIPETDYNGFSAYIQPAPAAYKNLTLGERAYFYRIDPENNGEASAGIAWGIKAATDTWVGNAPLNGYGAGADITRPVLMQTPRIPVQTSYKYYNLKISLDVLFDPRRNPFEQAGKENDEDNWKTFQGQVNFAWVPCQLLLYAADGKTYSYDNSQLLTQMASSESFAAGYEAYKGRWIDGDTGKMFLAWYDESDRKEKSGLNGWATNKQNIGRWLGDISKNITLNIDGEKMETPPQIGEMQFTVYGGMIYRMGILGTDEFAVAEGSLRWMLYKDLKIEVSSNSGGQIDTKDIVISAWLNKAAEEEFKIETYIGTSQTQTPMARGAILKSGDYTPIKYFLRGNITDSVEKLLIGTIYSNYAARRNTLTGTIKMIPENTVLSDNSTVNSRYVLLSETENLMQATAEIKMAEFANDDYEGIEYE